MRREDFYELNSQQINAIFQRHLNIEIQTFELIKSGLSNTNYKITLKNQDIKILRVHRKEKLGEKEKNINDLLAGHKIKMVPKVIYFADSSNEIQAAYSIIEYIDGIPWSQNSSKLACPTLLLQSVEFICSLHSITLKSAGILNNKLNIESIATKNTGHSPYVNYIYDCMENKLLRKRVNSLLPMLEKCIIDSEDLLSTIDYSACHLVHGDFKRENILTLGNTEVNGIIDWEYARSDLFYGDLATLFRGQYHAKNHDTIKAITNVFKKNSIPIIDNWHYAIKTIDFVNLLSFLTEEKERWALFETIKKHIENTLLFLKKT